MAGNLEINSNLDIYGSLKLSSVPNQFGTLLTYNSTSREIGFRSNSDIINDLGLNTIYAKIDGSNISPTTWTNLTSGNSINWGGIPYIDVNNTNPAYFITGQGNGQWNYSDISTIATALGIGGSTLNPTLDIVTNNGNTHQKSLIKGWNFPEGVNPNIVRDFEGYTGGIGRHIFTTRAANEEWGLAAYGNGGNLNDYAFTFTDGTAIGISFSRNGTITSNNIEIGFNAGYQAISANYDIGLLTLDHQYAQRLLTGGVLASDIYLDSAKIPTNGIYSKGVIKTSDNFVTDNTDNAGFRGMQWNTNGVLRWLLSTDPNGSAQWALAYERTNSLGTDYVSKLNVNESIDGHKEFTGAYTDWILNGDAVTNGRGFIQSNAGGVLTGSLNDFDYILYRNSIQMVYLQTNRVLFAVPAESSQFVSTGGGLIIRGNGGVNSNTTKLFFENNTASIGWAISQGVNNVTQENLSFGTWDGSTYTDCVSIDAGGNILTGNYGTALQWYQGYLNSSSISNKVDRAGDTMQGSLVFPDNIAQHFGNGLNNFAIVANPSMGGLNFLKPGVQDGVLFLSNNLFVGIGTTNPQTRLHTVGNNYTEGYTASLYGMTIMQSTGTGHGISLYGTSVDAGHNPDYGLMFAQTANYGTIGTTSGDWATYFTMQGANNRGWIFRHKVVGNVLGINGEGVISTLYHLGSEQWAYSYNYGLMNKGNSFVNNTDGNALTMGTEIISIEFANGSGNTNFGFNGGYGNFIRNRSNSFTTDLQFVNGGEMWFNTFYHAGGSTGANREWRRAWDSVNLTQATIDKLINLNANPTWDNVLANSANYRTELSPLFYAANPWKAIFQSRAAVGDNYLSFVNNTGSETHYIGMGSSNDNFQFVANGDTRWDFYSNGNHIVQIQNAYVEMYRDLYVSNGGVIHTSNSGNSDLWYRAYTLGILRDSTVGLSNASGTGANQEMVGKYWFDYNWAGTGIAGSAISFGGFSGAYQTELFGNYGNNGQYFGVRTYNGDLGQWNPVRELVHNGNVNNFIQSFVSGNYLPLTGGTFTGQGRINNNGEIVIQQAGTYNATGISWENLANTALLSGIGALTTADTLHHLYMGWGSSPWELPSNFAVSETYIRWKNQDLWHSGNFNPNSKVTNAENVPQIGFVNGDVTLPPYYYHSSGVYVRLATQDWINSFGFTNTTIGINGSNFTSGGINLIQGVGIVLNKSGNNITVDATGGGGSGVPDYLHDWADTRNIDTVPDDYNAVFRAYGIKEASIYGLGGGYVSVFGYRGWTDTSGGRAIEFITCDDDNVYYRKGDTNGWDAMHKIFTDTNLQFGSGLNYNNGIVTVASSPTRIKGGSGGFYTGGDVSLEAGTAMAIQQVGQSIIFHSSDTTYSAGNGLALSGTQFSQSITTSGGGNAVVGISQTSNGFQVNYGTIVANIPVATTTVLGGVKDGNGVNIAADGTLSVTVSQSGSGNVISSIVQNANGITYNMSNLSVGVTAISLNLVNAEGLINTGSTTITSSGTFALAFDTGYSLVKPADRTLLDKLSRQAVTQNYTNSSTSAQTLNASVGNHRIYRSLSGCQSMLLHFSPQDGDRITIHGYQFGGLSIRANAISSYQNIYGWESASPVTNFIMVMSCLTQPNTTCTLVYRNSLSAWVVEAMHY